MSLSRRDIFLALAKDVPDPRSEGKTAPIRQDLAGCQPQTAGAENRGAGTRRHFGTRDAFVELAMEGGCEEIPGSRN